MEIIRVATNSSGEFTELPKNPPRLEKWRRVVKWGRDCLQGVVTNHPVARDGTRMVTSSILYLDPDKKYAVTVIDWFILGEEDGDAMEHDTSAH